LTTLIDYHSHILPGLDDGCRDLDESLEMARVLVAAGFEQVYCTPHCMHGVYANTPEIVQAATAAFQRTLNDKGIALRLHAGIEYYLDEHFPQFLAQVQPLGASDRLLVEFPTQIDADNITNLLFQIRRKGLIPVIAHPERYLFLRLPAVNPGLFKRLFGNFGGRPANSPSEAAQLLSSFQNCGYQFQGNLGSLVGHYGKVVNGRARQLQQSNFFNFWGTDGHRPESTRKVLHKLQASLEQISAMTTNL
jgi:protein-tyrosine phosphatase